MQVIRSASRAPAASHSILAFIRVHWWLVFAIFAMTAHAQFSDRVTDLVSSDVKFAPGGIRLGQFVARPRLTTAAVYDDNILYQSGGEEDDFIGIVSPGISIGAGTYLLQEGNRVRFDYQPSFLFFHENSDLNTIDHEAKLEAEVKLRKTRFSLNQVVDISSSRIVEVSRRLESRSYVTLLRVQHPLGGKTDWELTGQQSIVDQEDAIGTRQWSGHSFINYRVTPKVRAGFGAGIGYRVQDESGQIFEQVLVNTDYEVSGKTRLFGSVGAEFAQYEDGGSDVGPIFTLGASWAPKEYTSFTLNAYRRTQPSTVLAGQNYTTTGFTLGVRQRLWRKMFLNLSLGYDNREYISTDEDVRATRKDDYAFARLDWNWLVTRQWMLGFFYLHRENDSTDVPFKNNLVGLQTTFTY